MGLFDRFKKKPPPGDHRVECPACGENMVDTGRRETSEITRTPMRIMACPCCGNECGVSQSAAEGDSSQE
jgi:hypothetical protein